VYNWCIAATSSPLRADSVEFVVGLLAEIDAATDAGEFYNRLCEALCRLTSMERAGLYLYDPTLRLVRAVGCHGVDPSLLAGVEGTLDETPIAQRALAEDQVVEASERLEEELPPRYARFAGITTITCTPVSAGGRWLGVIFADRGGGQFELTADERQAMWSLGKLAALASSVQQATIQREAARRLSERIDLIREIHEGVIQRLFGLVLVLGSDDEKLDAEQRRVCHDELRDVLGELRDALGRARRVHDPTTTMTVRQVLDRIGTIRDDLVVDWAEGVEVPSEVEGTAQAVLLEAIRNADKHANPTRIDVAIDVNDGNLVLEIVNDGARAGVPGTGLGLRVATIEALQHAGLVEFGPLPDDRWHVRLVVPTGA
jgi:signal transduction histidine kinase